MEPWESAAIAAAKAHQWAVRKSESYGSFAARRPMPFVAVCKIVLTGTPRKECSKQGRQWGTMLRVRCECMAQVRNPRRYGYDHLGDVVGILAARRLWEEHCDTKRNAAT